MIEQHDNMIDNIIDKLEKANSKKDRHEYN